MKDSDSRQARSFKPLSSLGLPASSFRPMLLALLSGAVLSVVVGLERIREQGYEGLGFVLSSQRLLADVVPPVVLRAGVFGLALCLLWFILWKEATVAREHSSRILSAPLVVLGLVVCALATRSEDPFSKQLGVALALGALGWSVLWLLWVRGGLFSSSPWIGRNCFRLLISSAGAMGLLAVFLNRKLDEEWLDSTGLLVVGLCWLTFMLVPEFGELRNRVTEFSVGLGLTVLLVVGVVVWSPSHSLSATRPKNILLIAVDTLRWDATSLGDSESDRTPNIALLAARGVTYSSAVSQAPWTLPAFSSIMTGLYPKDHQATTIEGRLSERVTTLAEILFEAGYSTSGVVSHLFVDASHGMAQGFETFDDSESRGHKTISSRGVTDKALAQLEARDKTKPFLQFVHYFDPHFVYQDHKYLSIAEDYTGWIDDEDNSIGDLRSKRHFLEPTDLSYLRSLYDEEVVHTDRSIGRLLNGLDSLGLTEETVVVLVSDHGEEFMERGWLGHTTTLHEEVIHVPMVLVVPGVTEPGVVVESPVETRSLFSSLLELSGARPPAPIEEPPLLPLRPGQGDVGPAFSQVWMPNANRGSGKRVRISSIREGDWKLIVDHTRNQQELYDLSLDPSEFENLAKRRPDLVEKYGASLQRWLLSMEPDGDGDNPGSLDQEEVQKLRDLGYVN